MPQPAHRCASINHNRNREIGSFPQYSYLKVAGLPQGAVLISVINRGQDLHPPSENLTKSRSREIGCYHENIALKCYRRLGSSAAENESQISKLLIHISQLRDFARFGGRAHYGLVDRGLGWVVSRVGNAETMAMPRYGLRGSMMLHDGTIPWKNFTQLWLYQYVDIITKFE